MRRLLAGAAVRCRRRRRGAAPLSGQARSGRPAGAPMHRRRRTHVHRHLRRRRSRSSTRPPRRWSATIKLKTGIPRSLTLSQIATKLLRARLDAREDRSRRHRRRAQTLDSFTLSERQQAGRASRGLQVDPLERVPDPADALGHQADRPLGDRRRRRCSSTTSRTQKITRTIPWPRGEEREGVNIRFSPDGKLLYLLRRRRTDARDRRTSPRSTRGRSASRSSRASAASTSARSHDFNDAAGLLHRPVHDAGPGAEPPHHGHRPRQPRGAQASTSRRSARPRRCRLRAGARPQARLRPDAGDRPLRVLGVRRREERRSPSAPSSRAGRAWACASRRTASCSTSTWPAPPSTSTTPPPTSTCAPSR